MPDPRGNWHESFWTTLVVWLASAAILVWLMWLGRPIAPGAKRIGFAAFVLLQVAWVVLYARHHKAMTRKEREE